MDSNSKGQIGTFLLQNHLVCHDHVHGQTCGSAPYNFQHTSYKRELKNKTKQKIDFCLIDYSKAFDCMDPKRLENSKRDRIPDHLPVLLETCVQEGSNGTMKQKTASELGKEITSRLHFVNLLI